MSIDTILEFERWYSSQCDGDWEHCYGIKITTLDNPGWLVRIELTGTSLEGENFQKLRKDFTESNWYHCFVEKNVFVGAGGSRNLQDILRTFLAWAEHVQMDDGQM